MPSQVDIDVAQHCSDAICMAVIRLSTEEGILMPGTAMSTNINLFAAVFAGFAVVPAAGGVGGSGRNHFWGARVDRTIRMEEHGGCSHGSHDGRSRGGQGS